MERLSRISMPNCKSGDVSELLGLALSNLDYTSKRIIHYSFLVEEALAKWREELPADAELTFCRKDTAKRIIITIELKSVKCEPFETTDTDGEAFSMAKVVDRLMSGVGSELRYSYTSGKNRICIRLPKKDADTSLFEYNLVILMIPIALQNLLEAVASNVDAFMLGFLDSASMSAVSLCAKYVQLHSFILMGMGVGVVAILSQYWGLRDRAKINTIASVSMKVAVVVSFIIGFASMIFPKSIISFYTDSPELIEKGAEYIRIISISFLIAPFYRMYYCFMRSTGMVKRSVRLASIGCAVNVVLNTVMIFGLFGTPAMGVKGAALATVLSGAVQVVLILIGEKKKLTVKLSFKRVSLLKSDEAAEFFRYSWPPVFQYLIWIIASNIVTAAIGHMGDDVVAANSVLMIVSDLAKNTAIGAGTAAGILIGNLLGKGKLAQAKEKSRLVIKIGVKIGIVLSAAYAVIGYCLRFMPLDIHGDMIKWMNILLVFSVIDLFFAIMNAAVNLGMLSAGGDAKGILIADTIVMWGILVPCALLSSYVVSGVSLVLLAILRLDEPISYPLKYLRYKSGKWLSSFTGK